MLRRCRSTSTAWFTEPTITQTASEVLFPLIGAIVYFKNPKFPIKVLTREGATGSVLWVWIGNANYAFGTSPLDALSFSLVPALPVGVGVSAWLIPALRAASIDPANVLRGE